MADEEQPAGFKVEDRRRLDAEGQAREPGDADVTKAAAEPGQAAGQKPELTFSSFVVGLATQALMFLGAMPAPSGQQVERNLGEAAVIIDILSMLERKTAGNLAEDEARLIEDILYDLRMRFVRETRAKAQQGSQPA